MIKIFLNLLLFPILEIPSDGRDSNKLRLCCIYLPPSKSKTLPNVKCCCNFLRHFFIMVPLSF